MGFLCIEVYNVGIPVYTAAMCAPISKKVVREKGDRRMLIQRPKLTAGQFKLFYFGFVIITYN